VIPGCSVLVKQSQRRPTAQVPASPLLRKLRGLYMITPILRRKDAIPSWLIDPAGNVAISISDLALLRRIHRLIIPVFVSTEQAMAWGGHLDSEQRATLLHIQRGVSNAARAEADPQRMVSLATQSQLMREAADAAASDGMASRREPLLKH